MDLDLSLMRKTTRGRSLEWNWSQKETCRDLGDAAITTHFSLTTVDWKAKQGDVGWKNLKAQSLSFKSIMPR